jgi:hypothetical protein
VLSGEAPPARQPPRRAARPLRVGLAAFAAAALLTGCGDDDAAPDEPAGDAPQLSVSLDADGPGGEPELEASVDCSDPTDPGPGVPEGAASVCGDVLLLSPEDAEPVPADVACTEIYGGPDLLTVTGTLEGESIDAELTRENGCEIDRFDRWVPLLRELFPGYRPGEAITP